MDPEETRSAPFTQKEWDLINVLVTKSQSSSVFPMLVQAFGKAAIDNVYKVSKKHGYEMREKLRRRIENGNETNQDISDVNGSAHADENG